MGKFRTDFYNHYKTVHDINVEIEELKFSSSNAFVLWLTKIEKESKTKFVVENGSLQNKASYICHRSGFFKPKGTGKRHLKTQGSKKIDGFCPAGLKVSVDENDGSHKVVFVKTHVGHLSELCHLTLSNEERKMLATKIATKMPFDTILHDIHHTVRNSSLERLALLSKKDLFNIQSCFNLHANSQRHKNDAGNVDAWVEEKKNHQLEIVENPTELESQLISQHMSTNEMKKPLSEKKQKLIEKLSNDINSIESKEEFAAVEKIVNSIGLTLRALRQEVAAVPEQIKEPHNKKIVP